ncbi:MAG TPA: flagellar basal body P-ring formation chaperone FlgA [Gemmataceae bacterium]|nr:flagellar basal body P-ring formation chaperone FlgA [Gemmataceae bacterium]
MRSIFSALAVVFSFVCVSGWCEAQQQPETQTKEPTVLALRATATVSGPQVKLGDIADLQGGDDSERERLAGLDLAELPLSSQPILVTRQQIGFRLQLAGLAADSYRLEGPCCVRVSRPAGEGLDAKIVAVARQTLEQRLSCQGDDYRIELAQDVSLPPLSADGSDIHLEGEVRSQVVPPCRVAVEVGIYVRGARCNGVLVYLDLKKLQPVPVAIRKIDSGEVFSDDNVRLERVAVENTQRAAVTAANLMGRHASRPMSAGHPIEPDDIAADKPAAAVIRANELVHLIATVGPLQVKTRGEALQDGRIGQAIQVRNLDTKSVVTGRVVDRSTVEVEY